ncbi:MAG: UDP-N-acetylmuramate--alanine ligase [Candidatus Aureabacteria bacterium]|nr:UDP-N-acetylmuramate--alanine ligase [Candidatus Auribacterota bacterium]
MKVTFPSKKKLHFIGIAGSGMYPLACFLKKAGNFISGSDRSFDNGKCEQIKNLLIGHGIKIFAQDGQFTTAKCDSAIYSGAIEETIPDYKTAKKNNIPLIKRSEMLSSLISSVPGAAISGTSGKSTTAGMLFHIMKESGKDVSFISGAKLIGGASFNFGEYPFLIIEADESDGSLINYYPETGVILNLSKDHMEISKLLEQFKSFISNSKKNVVLPRDLNIAREQNNINRVIYNNPAHFSILERRRDYCIIKYKKERFTLNLPGKHNILNCLAALAAAELHGINPRQGARAMSCFPGIERRLEKIFSAEKIDVFDDFAHNPDKISSSLDSIIPYYDQVIIIYQPHGYRPTKLLFKEIVQSFTRRLRQQDTLYLLPIYYAGGTAEKHISSEDIAREVLKHNIKSEITSRETLLKSINFSNGKSAVILMGARDPSLPEFARQIAKRCEILSQ